MITPVNDQILIIEQPDNCPVCSSTDLTARNYNGYGVILNCDVTCDSCGATWTEEYQLVARSDLSINHESPNKSGSEAAHP